MLRTLQGVLLWRGACRLLGVSSSGVQGEREPQPGPGKTRQVGDLSHEDREQQGQVHEGGIPRPREQRAMATSSSTKELLNGNVLSRLFRFCVHMP